ncbi:hypothetical protein DPX16_6630 [Anabarilius grahami]|uniref:Uncharacterized protein n=1 Tax=Anabarilius grahami TaxID=495550 RepID=A0A3N0Z290_ANAGA|nr:hypothetical protein DPX16_6630 [Anabarilius grahami]
MTTGRFCSGLSTTFYNQKQEEACCTISVHIPAIPALNPPVNINKPELKPTLTTDPEPTADTDPEPVPTTKPPPEATSFQVFDLATQSDQVYEPVHTSIPVPKSSLSSPSSLPVRHDSKSSSSPLILPSTKFPSSPMVSTSLSLPPLPSKPSSLLVSAQLVPSGSTAPPPLTQCSYSASGLPVPS